MQQNYPDLLRTIERYASALAPHAGPLLHQVAAAARALADVRSTPAALLTEDVEAEAELI